MKSKAKEEQIINILKGMYPSLSDIKLNHIIY